MSAEPLLRASESQTQWLALPNSLEESGVLINDLSPQVVFKALIVLHTMIRNGSTDNVLGYIAKSDILRLNNVANGHWEGEIIFPEVSST
jgi:hypothetical protein